MRNSFLGRRRLRLAEAAAGDALMIVAAILLSACAPDAPVEVSGLVKPEARWLTPRPALPDVPAGAKFDERTNIYIVDSRSACVADRRVLRNLQEFNKGVFAK